MIFRTMEEFEIEHTPFKRITDRFFFVTGYTEDNMVNDRLQLLNLEWMLHSHLQKLGYERIVFYDRNLKLYCYDERSMRYLRLGRQEETPTSVSQKSRMRRRMPAGMQEGPMGRRRIRRHAAQEDVSKPVDSAQNSQEDRMPLHMGKMDDLATYKQISSCLQDRGIKTVVIFTNANDFIRDYSNPEIADCFDRFVGSYADNKNIVTFIFPDRSESEICREYEHSGGIWKSLFEPAFRSGRNIIRIGLPNRKEICNLLQYMRLNPKKHLRINTGEMEEISRMLLKEAVSNHYQLKYIYHCLDTFGEKNQMLCADNALEVLGGRKEKSAMEELDEIIGMAQVKDEIRKLKKRIELEAEPAKEETAGFSNRLIQADGRKTKINMHMVLTGNPGTGKTTIARILGKIYYEIGLLPSPKVIEVDKQALVAGYIGQTAIKTQDKINEAMGKVLFIDEAYTLYQEENNNSNADSFGKEAVETLMKAMEDHRGEFAVIAAGYGLQMRSFLKANSGLAGRFDKTIHIADYEPEELNEIFHFMMRQRGYEPDAELEEALPGFFHNWTDLYRQEPPWSNAREVRKLLDDIDSAWSISEDAKTYAVGTGHKKLKQEHFPKYCQRNFKKGYRKKTGREELEELIGFAKLKEELRKLYHTKLQAGAFEEEDPVKLHCVLKGNPGTGKSTAARLLGRIYREIGWLPTGNVNEVQSSDLLSQTVNGTADKTRKEVQKALGGVLFVDEAYKLYRKDDCNHTGREAIEEIMKCMDQYKGQFAVVLAGYPEEMDTLLSANQGLQRRFSVQYVLEDYTAGELRQIFEQMLQKKHIRLSGEFQEKLPVFFENFLNTWGNDEQKEIWGNAGEVENLVETLRTNHAGREGEILTEGEEHYRLVTASDLPEHLQQLLHPMDSAAIWERLNGLVGLRSVKDRLKRIEATMNFQKGQSYAGHFIFKGNPGTGKTTIARLMGHLLRDAGALKRGHVVEHTAKELMEDRGTLAKSVKKAKNGILFIDEAHQLTEDGRGISVLTELIPILENQRENLTVICAGYPLQMDEFLKYDPGMPSRFPTQLLFEDYDEEELMCILESMAKQKGYQMEPEYREHSQMVMRGLAGHKTAGFGNARDVRTYLQASIEELSVRLYEKYGKNEPAAEETYCLTGEDIAQKYTQYSSAGADSRKTAMEKLDGLVGFTKIKEDMKKLLAIVQSPLYDGESVNLHCLITGNPGTGKTTVARILGQAYKEIGILKSGHVVETSKSGLVAGYVGQTASKTRKKVMEAMNGVLFIDEAYTLYEGREGDFGKEALEELLKCMTDYRGKFAVVAAGYPKEMEQFLQANPGLARRFASTFHIDDYTPDELHQIFGQMMVKKRLRPDGELGGMLPAFFENFIRTKWNRANPDAWGNAGEVENLVDEIQKQHAVSSGRIIQEEGRHIGIVSKEHFPAGMQGLLRQEQLEESDGQESALQKETGTKWIQRSLLGESGFNNHANQTKQERIERCLEAVVLVQSEGQNGEVNGYGTGFLVSADGCIITCHHVIADAAAVKIRLRMKKGEHTVWCGAKIASVQKECDLALLKIEGYYPSVLPLDNQELDIGQELVLLGYPFAGRLSDDINSLNPSYFEGSVSSKNPKGGYDRIYVNMEAKSGCSGAPVISVESGNVAGILCGSVLDRSEDLTEELNYIVPVRYIWQYFVENL